MFYLPNFLNPGFVAVNLDLVPPMIIKMIIDVGALGVFVLLVIPAFGVFVFFLPILIQRGSMAAGPILKMLFLASLLLFVYLLFMGYLDPIFQGLINFLEGK